MSDKISFRQKNLPDKTAIFKHWGGVTPPPRSYAPATIFFITKQYSVIEIFKLCTCSSETSSAFLAMQCKFKSSLFILLGNWCFYSGSWRKQKRLTYIGKQYSVKLVVFSRSLHVRNVQNVLISWTSQFFSLQ